MKKHILTTILIITLLLGGVALFPHQAEAVNWMSILSLITNGTDVGSAVVGSFWESILSQIGEVVLRVSSYVLTLSGVILNMAIVLTLNIKAIYEATPAIEQVWIVIRNISSIFIIFALVYISIRKILDVDSPSLGTMIKNIVIAGLLINFSLFFTRVAIDASNLISMQFYRAIAPNSQNITLTDKGSISALLANSLATGGISDVFMQNLKLPKIYNNSKGIFSAGEGGTSFKILVATTLGSILMITAALSFFAAAIAFIIRLVLLLLLMGFSPIFFVGMIFPDVQKNISGKWWGYLEQQLVFMPVYLLFMYVALRFINGATPGEGFFAALDNAQLSAGRSTDNGWLLSTVGLTFQYAIAYILINIPLIAAQQTGGISVKWGIQAKDWVKGKIGAGTKGGFGFAAQHGIGRGASALREKVASSEFARSNPNLAILTDKSLGKVSGATFGGTKGGYDDRKKKYEEARFKYATKEIKLTEAEKARIDSQTAASMTTWDTEWRGKETRLRRDVTEAESDYNTFVAMGAQNSEGGVKARKKLEQAQEKLKTEGDRGLAEKAFRNDHKKDAERAAKEKYADELGKSGNVFTRGSNEAAAKKIKEELNKSEEKKLLELMRRIASDADKAASATTPPTPTP